MSMSTSPLFALILISAGRSATAADPTTSLVGPGSRFEGIARPSPRKARPRRSRQGCGTGVVARRLSCDVFPCTRHNGFPASRCDVFPCTRHNGFTASRCGAAGAGTAREAVLDPGRKDPPGAGRPPAASTRDLARRILFVGGPAGKLASLSSSEDADELPLDAAPAAAGSSVRSSSSSWPSLSTVPASSAGLRHSISVSHQLGLREERLVVASASRWLGFISPRRLVCAAYPRQQLLEDAGRLGLWFQYLLRCTQDELNAALLNIFRGQALSHLFARIASWRCR